MGIVLITLVSRACLARITITHILGLSATFYLGLNLLIGGGWAEIPIVLLSLIVILFFRHDKTAIHDSINCHLVWAFLLLGFALWNCFAIWFHSGEIELYEPYAKLLVGSIAAFALAYHRVTIAYIRVGLYIAAISLIYIYFFEYSGNGRFSNGMNPNKWSPLLLSYAVTTFILFFLEKSRWFKVMAFLSWCIFVVFVLIAASRSTSLLLALVTAFGLLFMILRSKSLMSVVYLVGFIFAGFVLFNYSGSSLEPRLKQFTKEYSSFHSNEFTTSSGFRFIMWKSGVHSILDHVLMGSGFNLAKSIEVYEPDTEGEAKAIKKSQNLFGSFHNVWIDALVSQGVLGLSVLLTFFIVSLKLIHKNRTYLMLGPLVAVGLNGLTESTLYMSILAGHLALAGAIFMNIEDDMKS